MSKVFAFLNSNSPAIIWATLPMKIPRPSMAEFCKKNRVVQVPQDGGHPEAHWQKGWDPPTCWCAHVLCNDRKLTDVAQ